MKVIAVIELSKCWLHIYLLSVWLHDTCPKIRIWFGYQTQAIEFNMLPITKLQDYPHQEFWGNIWSIHPIWYSNIGIFSRYIFLVSEDIDLGIYSFKDNLKMDSVFVMGNVKFVALITEEDYINKIIQWIGFTTEE